MIDITLFVTYRSLVTSTLDKVLNIYLMDAVSQLHRLQSKIQPVIFVFLEQFSNECRKTKTKVITLPNQKRHRQSSEPIKTRSKYM